MVSIICDNQHYEYKTESHEAIHRHAAKSEVKFMFQKLIFSI